MTLVRLNYYSTSSFIMKWFYFAFFGIIKLSQESWILPYVWGTRSITRNHLCTVDAKFAASRTSEQDERFTRAVRLAVYLVLTLVNIASCYRKSSISPWYKHLYLNHTMPNWVTWIRHKQGIYFNRKFTADIFIYLIVHVRLAPRATAWGLRVKLIIKNEWDFRNDFIAQWKNIKNW